MKPNTYVLVADAHRARCFESEAANLPLVEHADFVSPHTTLNSSSEGGDLTGAAGKGHGRTGHAGTQFEPKTEAQDKERGQFARQLADYLNSAADEHRYQNLVLIATSPMLGDLKPLLNSAASRFLSRSISKDMTHYVGADLQARINQALD